MNNTLYCQSGFPVLQNRVYDSAEAGRGCAKGDIQIVIDQKTGLINNAAFCPELMVYDVAYNNEQGLSQCFCRHLEQVAQLIEIYLGREGLVEVGCGKGFFLEMLLKRGLDVTGFDSTYDGENPRVVKKYFESGLISTISKGLILRHVLEHIPNPVDFLFQIKQENGNQGLIYIEVPCFDWICKRRAWFDIFYEHVNYFRVNDFYRMFGRVIKSGHFFGGQYLYIIADLSTLRVPVFDPSCEVILPTDFLANLTSAEQSRAGHPITVWGGASKGVIFSLLRERMGLPVDIVIDVNPAKQGRFLPGTGLQVWPPEIALRKLPPGSTIYVMNSIYLDEIKTMSNHTFNYIGIDQ